jgi:hypothetical protein
MFNNYDRWLEQPYHDQFETSDREEWILENSTYFTDCCDRKISPDLIEFDNQGFPLPITCSFCKKISDVITLLPNMEENDEKEEDIYFDDPSLDYLN